MRDKTNYLHHVVLERQLLFRKACAIWSTRSSTITRPSSVVSFFRKYTIRGQKVFLSVVQRPIPSGIRNSLFAAQTMRRYGFARRDSCSCSKGRVHRFYIYPQTIRTLGGTGSDIFWFVLFGGLLLVLNNTSFDGFDIYHLNTSSFLLSLVGFLLFSNERVY